MPPLPRVTGRELIRALGKLGWRVVTQKGSHAQLKHLSEEPEQGGGYYMTVPALPGCFTRGGSSEECRQRAVEAIEVHIAGLQADGEPVPEEVGSPQLPAVTVAA
jgi:antitoxin HicB